MIPTVNTIYPGHVLDIIREWDDNLIDMCITSPPYWGLRTYNTNPQIWDGDPDCDHDWVISNTNGLTGGPPTDKMKIKGGNIFQRVEPTEIASCSKCGAWRGELGQEEDYDQFVFHLCDIFDEIKRILALHGTLWVNIDDSHFGNKGKVNKLNSKCLTGIPFRFAIEMINRGWILRTTNIWYKSNPMPESVNDRPTIDFEYVFMFSKRPKYYYKQQFEPLAEATKKRAKYHWAKPNTKAAAYQKENGLNRDISYMDALNPLGKNKRAVWSNIKPSQYHESHFAVYPEDLLNFPINACLPKEVCTKCGKPREWIIERNKVGETKSGGKYENIHHRLQGSLQWEKPAEILNQYWSDCGCNVPFKKGIVFDPFMGSGTTAYVALEKNLNFLGTELNLEYINLAKKRLDPLLKNKKIDMWLK